MSLILRRRTTGEILLQAGGVWDHRRKCYADRRPRFSKVILVNESQVEFVRYFAVALADLRAGRELAESLVACVGDRRAGKTFIVTVCLCAFVIELPRLGGSATIAWAVSKAYGDRDEIEKTIEEYIPGSWYIPKKGEYRYYFKNGGVLRNMSADDPESLRRGRVDVVLYNEAQKMPLDALSNGIYGTADRGGLALLAANPPKKKIGEWVYRLKEAYDEERIGGVKFFPMSSKDNPSISKPARDRVGAIMRLLDPKRAAADDDGEFQPIGDKAYEKFNGRIHLRPAPVDVQDVTAEVTRKKLFGKWEYFGGVDFQGHPWNAAVILQAFGDPAAPVYHAVAEFLKEGWEDDLLDEISFVGEYQPENTVWVGDASGTWQDGHHSRGRVSFDIFKARRHRIVPPQVKKSDRGEHPRNPDIGDRLNLVNRLLAGERLFVDPEKCPRLAEALRECDFADDKPRGKHAHITDALGYALWWIEPLPKPARARPTPGTFVPFKQGGRGPRSL